MESLVTKKSPPFEGGSGARRKSPSADQKALIAHHLRRALGEIASEPVPDRLMELVDQLDKKLTEGKQ